MPKTIADKKTQFFYFESCITLGSTWLLREFFILEFVSVLKIYRDLSVCEKQNDPLKIEKKKESVPFI